jgi:phosphatidylserine/phosphatidylglycerophosphate/cardiolipin synthase-like enzyme
VAGIARVTVGEASAEGVIPSPLDRHAARTLPRMRSVLGAVLLVAGSIVACSSSHDGGASSDSAFTEGPTGGFAGLIEQDLMVRHPGEKGRTWTITKGNTLAGNWLMQVPAGNTWGQTSVSRPIACSSDTCDADLQLATCTADAECGGGTCAPLNASKKSDDAPAARLCVGHSDGILDEIYGVMTSAHSTLDISTLSAPTGRFLATMRNALTTLDARKQPVSVRVLIGSFPDATADLPKLLHDLTRDVRNGQLQVTVGAHRKALTSWNHSKIIAADGVEAIIGGMNLWEDHYLDDNPVHDVSLHVRGPIAATAQIYENLNWAVPCGNRQVLSLGGGNACPRPYVPSATALARGPGNVQMMGVGRLGAGDRDSAKQALVSMMDDASTSIKIAQQDIGSIKLPGGVLPNDYLDAWIRAARRNVDVTVIVSNENSFGGSGNTRADSYSNGWSLQELSDGLQSRLGELGFTDADICAHVHFANIRSSAAATWPNGRPLANHAKVVIVDDEAFYVGSQNLYEADLAEYGVIVDDPTATKKFVADYYSKLADFSKVTTFKPQGCR